MNRANELFSAAKSARAPEAARNRVWSNVAQKVGLEAAVVGEVVGHVTSEAAVSAKESAGVAAKETAKSSSLHPAAAVASSAKSALLAKIAFGIGAIGAMALLVPAALHGRNSPSTRPENRHDGEVSSSLDPLAAVRAPVHFERSIDTPPPRETAALQETNSASLPRSTSGSASSDSAKPSEAKNLVKHPMAKGASKARPEELLAREAGLVMLARAAIREGRYEEAQARLREIQDKIPSPQLLPEEFELERRIARSKSE